MRGDDARTVSIIYRVDDPAALEVVEYRPTYVSKSGYEHPEHVDVHARELLLHLSLDAARELVERVSAELEKAGDS